MANPEITNENTGSLVLEDGKFEDITLNAPGAITYPKGQVLAFDAAAGKWKKTQSGIAAVANAKAILAQETVFSGAGDRLVRAVIGGVLDKDLLVFAGGDTIDTIPAGADDSFGLQLRDYGIEVLSLAEQRIQDNQ